MSDLVARTKAFAMKAHAGVVRANSARKPYHTHPDEVAELVRISGGTEEEIAAGELHDVVEENPTITNEDIAANFGNAIAEIVDGLTDLPSFKGLPTAERKRLQAERVAQERPSIKLVKLADQICNLRDIASDPPTLWDHQKCLDYTNGAKLIAEACRDINEYLDAEFQKAYNAAIAAHS